MYIYLDKHYDIQTLEENQQTWRIFFLFLVLIFFFIDKRLPHKFHLIQYILY